jgi:hypothetical protein
VSAIDKPQVRRIALKPFESQELNNRITLHVVHREVLKRKNEVDNFPSISSQQLTNTVDRQ